MLVFLFGLLLIQLMAVAANPCAGIEGPTFVQGRTCDTYYYCKDSVAFQLHCPNGYLFDLNQQACSLADLVYCNDQCIGVPNSRFVPRRSAGCGAYYACQDDVGTPLNCPDGFHFNYDLQACDYPENVNCNPSPPTAPTVSPTSTTTLAPGPCIGKPFGYFLLYPTNGCGGWQRCENDIVAATGTCNDGLYLSVERQTCADPASVNCVL